MHTRTILAIARKDAIDILLNKSTLSMLLTPIFLSVLFAVISALFASHSTGVLVYNPSNSNIVKVVSGAFSDAKVTQAASPADVQSAFGADGSHKSSSYAVGLVVPANFEAQLQAGSHPQLSLYVNGDNVSITQRQLLLSALTDYSRSVANPQPPVGITTATINPPSNTNFAVDLGKFYVMAALLSSFLVGTALMPGLLVEEKERKTLRMLMVSPASFTDVVVGKLLVGLSYQLLLSGIVLVIQGGFVGEVPVVLLFILLGSCFSLATGLLFGSIFQTASAAGAFAGIVGFIYIVPSIFTGPIAQAFGNNIVVQVVKVIPTYYVADGALNALLSKSTLGDLLLDAGVIAGCTVVLLLVSVGVLRQQAAVAGSI